MTAPTTGRDGATLRGAVVLVVAIVIGLALLARSGGDDSGAAEAATTGASSSSTTFAGSTSLPPTTAGPIASSSTTTPTTPTTPPEGPDTRPPADVSVLVLNGTSANVEGIAADNEAKVAAAGYAALDATGAVVDLTTTTIYADPELQADAEAVRSVLGIPDAVIEPKPSESPGPGSDEASIVVVIGDDAAG